MESLDNLVKQHSGHNMQDSQPNATSSVWDFWFTLSIAESVLTLCFILLTLKLLSKVDWTVDKPSLMIIMVFIITYICKQITLIDLCIHIYQ